MSAWAVAALERTNDMFLLGHYSQMTARNYLAELRWLFCYYAGTRPSKITYDMTVAYLVYLTKTLRCSRTKCRMAAQAFSFFFRHVLRQPYQVPAMLYPAHSGKLPAIMSTGEVRMLIDGISNVKHRTIVSLLYSTGMRLGEAARVRIADIDSKAMRIKVVGGKGNKDRYVPLGQALLLQLRAYYIAYRPEGYLFYGCGKQRPYSPRSIQHIVSKQLAVLQLGSKNYSVHTIRHSFATHLIDNGADLHSVMEMMGHCNLSQTMHYLHMSTHRMAGITNPLDALPPLPPKPGQVGKPRHG